MFLEHQAACNENIVDFLKVKSHQDLLEVKRHRSATEYRHACGNDMADRHAKLACALHPCDKLLRNVIDDEIADALTVCKVISAVIPLWPPIELKAMARIKTAAAAAAAAAPAAEAAAVPAATPAAIAPPAA